MSAAAADRPDSLARHADRVCAALTPPEAWSRLVEPTPPKELQQWCRQQSAKLLLTQAEQQLRAIETHDVSAELLLPPLQAEEIGYVLELVFARIERVTLAEDRRALTWGGDRPGPEVSKRKAAGVFFTPPVVAELLVQRSLGAAIERCLAGHDSLEALGRLRVIDPACGVGHLLMVGARRLDRALRGAGASDPRDRANSVMASLCGVEKDHQYCAFAQTLLKLCVAQSCGALPAVATRVAQGDALLGLLPAEINGDALPPWLKPLPGDTAEAKRALRRVLKELQKPRSTLAGLWGKPGAAQTPKRADALAALTLGSREELGWQRALLTALSSTPADVEARRCADAGVHWALAFPDVQRNGGFDALIANPPYVDSESMTRQSPRLRAAISTRFDTCRGNWDLFIPFVQLSTLLVRPGGYFSLVTPTKLFAAEYAAAAQQVLNEQRLEVVYDLSELRAFKEASVDVAVCAGRRDQPAESIRFVRRRATEGDSETWVSPTRLRRLPPGYWSLAMQGHPQADALLDQLERNVRLSEIAEVCDGASTREAYRIGPALRASEGLSTDQLRIVNTGTIDPFRLLWSTRPMRYLGQTLARPVLSAPWLRDELPRRHRQATSDKVVVAGLARRIEAAFAPTGTLCGKSAIQVIPIADDVCPYALCAWLNAPSTETLYRALFGASGLGGSLQLSRRRLAQMPCPPPSALRPAPSLGQSPANLLSAPPQGPTALSAIGRAITTLASQGEFDEQLWQQALDRAVTSAFSTAETNVSAAR